MSRAISTLPVAMRDLRRLIRALDAGEVSEVLGALGRQCRGGTKGCPPCELANAISALRPVLDPNRYGNCPECHALRGIYAPKGGDGSTRLMRPHKHNGKRCEGTREPAIGWE